MATILSLMFTVMAVIPPGPAGEPSPAADVRPVVFICEHGSVKSLIAREWFNRLAQERGLPVRAISRGVTPDASIPATIAMALRGDGFDVRAFTPERVDASALSDARRIVAIGLERDVLPAPPSAAVETWDGIPPATERYAAARNAIKARIEILLKNLETPESR